MKSLRFAFSCFVISNINGDHLKKQVVVTQKSLYQMTKMVMINHDAMESQSSSNGKETDAGIAHLSNVHVPFSHIVPILSAFACEKHKKW